MPLTPQEQRELDRLELEDLIAQEAASSGSSLKDQIRAAGPGPHSTYALQPDARVDKTPAQANAEFNGALKTTAATGSRYGLPLVGSMGGPVGALSSMAGEKGAQMIEGSNDPGAVTKAGVIGAIPLGKVKGMIATLKNAGKFGIGSAVGTEAQSLVNDGKLADGGDVARDAAIGGGVPLAAATIGKVAGRVMGYKDPADVAKMAALKQNKSLRDQTLADFAKDGGVIRGSDVNPSLKNNLLESIAGPTALENKLSEVNQDVTNVKLRREASVAPNVPMKESVMKDARATLSGPYDEITAVSNKAKGELAALEKEKFTAPGGHELAVQKADPATNAIRDPLVIKAGADIETLQTARQDAKDAWQAYKTTNPTPEGRKAAEAATSRVEALEDNIDQAAQLIGDPSLLERLRNSRKMFAKNYDVEATLNAGNGDANAKDMLAMMDRRGQGSMSGESAEVARFAAAFPKVNKPGAGLNTTPSAVTAGLSASMGANAVANANPVAAATGILPYLRKPLANHIASPGYQAANARPRYDVAPSADPAVIAGIIRMLQMRGIDRKDDKK